jgi:hypothetical protein
MIKSHRAGQLVGYARTSTTEQGAGLEASMAASASVPVGIGCILRWNNFVRSDCHQSCKDRAVLRNEISDMWPLMC